MEHFQIKNYLTNNVIFEGEYTSFIDCVKDAIKENISFLNANFEGENIEKVNFMGSNLKGAQFTNAYLKEVNFQGANLTSANLSYAYLSNANFEVTNCINTFFRYANLTNANFQWSDLAFSDFSHSNLESANFSCANLISVNFKKTSLKSANIDYTAFPLWCGSLEMKTDEKLRIQLGFHFASLIQNADNASEKELDILNYIKEYVNQFHRQDVKRIK